MATEQEPVDTALAYVWIVAAVLVILLIGLFFAIIPRLKSRSDYLHVFVVSLLVTRVLYCGFVLITAAVVTLKNKGWDIIPCQVAFWGWTTTWLTDCLTVMATLICAFVLIRKTTTDRRTHSDVVVAAIWVVSTITASCLILVRDEIDDKDTSSRYSGHCWTLPYTHQQLFGLSFILVFLIACIFITALISILAICILPVYKKPEVVSGTDAGPQLTRYHNNVNNFSNGKKQVTFANGNTHAIQDGSHSNVTEPSQTDTGSADNLDERPKRPSGVEPLDLTDLNSARSSDVSSDPQPESPSGEMDALDRVNILCTISSITVFLNLIPQSLVLGISLLRETPVDHGEDILLACGVLHSLLLPVGLCIASRPYRKALVKLVTPSRKTKDPADSIPSNVAVISPNEANDPPQPSLDDYVVIDVPQIQITSATPQISDRRDHSKQTKRNSSRKPNRSASSIWSRDEDMRRRRAMSSVKRTQSNQTMREWLQNLRNSIIEGNKVDEDLRDKKSSGRKKVIRHQSTTSTNSDDDNMAYNDSDINDVLDTLDEEDEKVIRDVIKEAEAEQANSSANISVVMNSSQEESNNTYDEITSTIGRSSTPRLDNPEYCRLEDIEVMVQTKTPFHVSQKYAVPDNDSRNERLRYIIQELEDAGISFVIDHRGLVHVFDHPDNLPRSLDTTLDTINRSQSPVEFTATETPQDEALYIDLYARATNPFNKDWQPVYAESPSLNSSNVSDAEIIAITYRGRRPSATQPSPSTKKKTNNPFLTTSFLKKFMIKRNRNEHDSPQSRSNRAYVPSEPTSQAPTVWDTGVRPETTQQLQFHTLGYQGAYVTSNNPFMTSSPIEPAIQDTNPFNVSNVSNNSNLPLRIDSRSSRGTNPFNTAPIGGYPGMPPGVYNHGYSTERAPTGRRRRSSILPFNIIDLLRSKSENLAVYDNGQVNPPHTSHSGHQGNAPRDVSHDYYNYNRTNYGSNPFVIRFPDYPQNEMYTTDYV